MSTIKFVLDDDFNQRTVEFKTTLGGDSIDHYYDAFEAIEEYQTMKPGADEESEAWAKMRKVGL